MEFLLQHIFCLPDSGFTGLTMWKSIPNDIHKIISVEVSFTLQIHIVDLMAYAGYYQT